MTINPAVLAAMKAKSASIQALRTPKHQPAPKSNYEPATLASLFIDCIPKTLTIEAHFDGKPTPEQVKTLIDCGFTLNLFSKRYVAENTGTVRANLTREFGADFSEEATPETPIIEEPKAIEMPKIVTADDLDDDEPSDFATLPNFETYRNQVDELLDHLKCRPADLMLMAIDALHKSLLGRN